MGFLIGLLTGAVVALLYAPKTGDIRVKSSASAVKS